MKTRNPQHKSAKLKLNKIAIVDLTAVEMLQVNGGAPTGTGANTGTGGGGTNTLRTTTRTVHSVAPSGPCTGEPIPYTTSILTASVG